MNYHQITSFIKSGLRIIGIIYLLFSIPIAVGFLVLAELMGIIEEL